MALLLALLKTLFEKTLALLSGNVIQHPQLVTMTYQMTMKYVLSYCYFTVSGLEPENITRAVSEGVCTFSIAGMAFIPQYM